MLNPRNTGSSTSTQRALGSFAGQEVLDGWPARVPMGLAAWFHALCFDAGKLELSLTNLPTMPPSAASYIQTFGPPIMASLF